MPTRPLARSLLAMTLIASGLVLTPAPAGAAFHFMRIREVFAGVAGAPDAQFVELQMYLPFQVMVSGHKVDVFDADGDPAGSFTFTANVLNPASQATILVATEEAETFFGVTADLVMDPAIAGAGGKACFDDIDCVSWGTFSGPGSTPSPSGDPFNRSEGIVAGAAIVRDISDGSPATLEESDDTNDSADNFDHGAPTPQPNAGLAGAAPGGSIGFDQDAVRVGEDAGTASITVHRSGGSEAVQVTFSTRDGTATAGDDYTSASETVAFADGETSKTVEVPVAGDTVPEADETLKLMLRDPTGGAVLDRPDATLTIEDDEAPDEGEPSSRIVRPRHGGSVPGSVTFRGKAEDAESEVALVEVALRRKLEGRGCRWWTGSRFTRAGCSDKLWNDASGTKRWTYDVSKRLPSSVGTTTRSYTLLSRATDASGNAERGFKRGRNASTFEVA